MLFNADAYQSNAEPPSISLGGRVYTGQILSFEEWIPYQKMLLELQRYSRQVQQSTDPAVAAQEAWLAQQRVRHAVKVLVNAMFPRSRWWRVWETRVSSLLARRPMDVQLEALNHFMVSQATSLGIEMRKTEPPTATTDTTTAP